MITRVIYTLEMLCRYGAALRAYRSQPLLQSPTVTALNPSNLKSRGFRILVIDFDGVLAPHGETVVKPKTASWLSECLTTFGAGNIFILSNKPTEARAHYFAKSFPGITFIKPKRKKPYPDGLLEILAATKIKPNELLLIDDRLLTGILAATIANTGACYITHPVISMEKRPIQELFFIGLRALERLIIRP